jgi:histone H3/H4
MNRWDSQRNQCSDPEEVAPAAEPVRQSPSPSPPAGDDLLAEAEAAAAAQAQLDADVLPVSYGDERLASKNALEFELPRATTAKLTKRFLGPKEAKDQELQAALARAGGLFAMTCTYAATDVCLENKRQTIGPQDVLTALDALGFEQDDLNSLTQFLERDKERRPKHTSGDGKKYRGVYQGSIIAWYSQISIGGQPIHLGSYAAPADAAKAYDRAIWSKLGVEAAALLNFPELIPESLPYVAEAKQRQMEQEAEKARQRDEKIRLREEKEALREQRRLEKEEKKRLKKPAKRRKKQDDPGFYK